jgi:threonine/homoserine/homoserine lactone efflux protein
VVLANPAVLRAFNWIGAAFLLWLSWKIATAGRSDAAAGRKPVGFVGTAAFQWIDPKSWLVCASAAGTYLNAESGGALAQAMAFGALFILRPCPVASCGWPSAPPRSDFYAPSAPCGRSVSPWVRSWPDQLS